MKQKNLFNYLSVLTIWAVLLLTASCEQNSNEKQGIESQVSNVISSDCLGYPAKSNPNEGEVFILKALNDNQLQVSHKKVIFDCLQDSLKITCDISNDSIFITEISYPIDAVNCVCNYDIEYTILLPDTGNYVFTVESGMVYKYKPFNFQFDENLDLTIQPQL